MKLSCSEGVSSVDRRSAQVIARGLAVVLSALSCQSDSLDGRAADRDHPSGGQGARPEKPPPFTDSPMGLTNTGTDVGALSGELSVTQHGSFSYVVPLFVPDGRNGLQPNLALSYLSTGGETEVGVGWSLRGLGEIRRCGHGSSRHVRPGAIEFGGDGEFCLSGSPLVLVAGQSAQVGAEYRTEPDTFVKVTVTESDELGPRSFEVRSREGRILGYGSHDDARVEGYRVGWSATPGAPRSEPPARSHERVRYSWLLASMADRFGNRVEAHYQHPDDARREDGHQEPLLREIGYAHVNGAARRQILFHYRERPDPDSLRQEFVAGLEFRRSKLLAGIDVRAPMSSSSSALECVRLYRLSHTTSPHTKRNLLTAVEECDGDPAQRGRPVACKRPSRFTYEAGSEQFQEHQTVARDVRQPGLDRFWTLQIADINNDGKDDVVYRSLPSGQKNPDWFYRLSDGTRFGDPIPMNIGDKGGTTDLVLVDLDQDGRVDAIRAEAAARVFRYFRNAGGSFVELPQADPGNEAATANLTTGIYVGDYSGKSRLTVLRPRNDGRWGYRFLAAGGLTDLSEPLDVRWDLPPSSTVWNAYNVDIDNDGALDFLALPARADSGRLVAMIQEDVPLSPPGGGDDRGHFRLADTTLLASTASEATKYHFGDFNGDGVTDALRLIQSASAPDSAVNTGNGFSPPTRHRELEGTTASIRVGPGATGGDLLDAGVQVADFDGDGRRDLFLLDNGAIRDRTAAPNPAVRSRVTVLLSRSSGFQPLTTAIPLGAPADGAELFPARGALHNWKQSRLLDANGDGLTDIVQVSPEGVLRLATRQGKRPDMLTAVKDGMGKRLDVDYAPMNDVAVYAPGDGCSFPQHCTRRGMWLTRAYRVDNGVEGGQNEVSYTYADGRSDLEGGGFIGFGRSTRNDAASNTITTEAFDLDARETVPPLSPAMSRAIVFSKQWVPASRTTETRVKDGLRRTHVRTEVELVETSGGRSYYVRARGYDFRDEEVRSTSTVPLKMSRREIFYRPEENDFGVVQAEETRTTTAAGEFVERFESEYVHRPEAWLIGLATKVTYSSRTPTREESRVTLYERDPETGALAATVVGVPGTDTYQRTEYLRNDLGQIARTTSSGGAGAGAPPTVREESVSFDADSVFPRSFRNALGHLTTVVANPVFGLPEAVTDANGVQVRYAYDGFGRQVRLAFSGGGGTTWRYSREPDPDSREDEGRFLMKVVQITDGGGELRSFYNRLGQAVRRETRRPEGRLSYSNLRYTDLGQMASFSRPAEVGLSEGVRTEVGYDDLARVVSRRRRDEGQGTTHGIATSTADYDGRITTITDELGRPQRVTEDELGRVVRTELRNDAGQWIPTTFTYHPYGMLESATRTDGTGAVSQVTSLEYDALGRRTKISDPDGGTSSFRFNGFGEVREETDGNEQMTTFERDALGRVTARHDKDGTTRFTWDTGDFAVGRLAESLSPDGVRRQFSFDAHGRLVRELWTTRGSSYQLDFAYDVYGRLERLTYPASPGTARLVVEYRYDPDSGEILRVAKAGARQPYWEAGKTDESGNLLEERFGNGVVTSYGRSSLTGRITSIKSVRPETEQTLKHTTYGYWADGNPVRQSDELDGLHERFEYDSLNRIRRWVRADAEGRESAGGWKVAYTIDDLGNLGRRMFTPGTSSHDPAQDVSYTFFPGSNRLRSAPWGEFEYDGRGNQVRRPQGEVVDYTAFGLPRSIQGPRAATFQYDAAGLRAEKRLSDGDHTVYVAGVYERRRAEGATSHVFYVHGKNRIIAQVVREEAAPGERTLYLHSDRQGSIDLATEAGGAVVERMRRDPFGNHVKDFDRPILPGVERRRSKITLGFTEHEDDAELGLINMKGRLYDPRLARFITPDPLVPSAFHGPSYNRFSYTLNNPLRQIDPTGFSEVEVDEATAKQLEDAGFTCTGSGSTRTCDDGGGVESITITEEPTCQWYYIECRDDDCNEASDSSSRGDGGGGGGQTTPNSGQNDEAGNNEQKENREETEEKVDCKVPAAGSGAEGSSLLDNIQAGLDIASIALDATGIGAAVSWLPDAANAGISLGRGDYVGAGLSLAAAIPAAGNAANVARLGRRAAQSLPPTAGGARRAGGGPPVGDEAVPDFDAARREAFENSGLTNPEDVTITKYDPVTGTAVEFKGPRGAEVGYDGPHPNTPGPHHDTQHISWQSAGKRRSGEAERGNIPYSGPRHPSRPEKKGCD